MKGKMKKRVMSVFMALLMTISLLPTDFLGGKVVEVWAADTTYTLTPAAIADSAKSSDGTDTYIADGTFGTAFELVGAKWRWYSDRLDGGKSNNCKLVYTVQTTGGTGKLEVVISSTGSGKNSVITLTDSSGNPVAMSDGNTSITLTDSTQTTLTWENLDQANGPYTLSSANDKMRVYSVTATEKSATTAYTFAPTDITDGDKTSDGTDTYINDGTYNTAFELVGAKWRWYSDRLDGGKSNNCKLIYTVQSTGGTGKLEVVISSTGSGKNSVITLTDSSGNPVAMSDGNTSITLTDSTQKTLTWENLNQANGPYTLSSANDKMRVYSVTATEAVSAGPIAAPTAATITVTADATDASKLTISGTGTAGDDGSKYIIVRTNAAGDEKTLNAAGNSASFSVEDTLDATGEYTYKVYGQGKDDAGNATTTAEVAANAYSYVLPLGKVVPSAAADNASVKLSWSAVKEATSYDVKVYEGSTELTAKAQTGITTTSVTIDGLTNGTEYSFVVIAHRANPSATTQSDKVSAKPVAPEAGVSWLKADLLNIWSSSDAPYVVDDMWSLVPGGSSLAVESMDSITTSDGLTFSQRISTKGSGSAAPKRVVQLTLTEDSYVVIYAASSGASRPLVVAKDDGTIVTELSLTAKDAVVDPSRAIDLKAGTYYFYSTGGTGYIYGIKVAEGSAPRADWSTVPNPTINSVTVNADGTITVAYDALLGTDGADGGRVFMYQNGFEVANVDASSTGEATFSPSTDGDFTFKVIISRTGEADKESNVYSLTGYEKPLESPVITWVDNLGNGSVYVDWNNITADSFDVLYKEAATRASDYTTAVEGLTAGNYTITGLTPGKTYEIKVVAHNSLKGDSSDTETITVGEPVQQWYADVFGSATASTITINGTSYSLKAQEDNYPAGNKVEDVTNNGGTITIASSTNGKVADSEEGITIYYTKINPSTENFKMTATFKVVDDSSVNNQSAYGIFATDIAGVGSKDAKYFNSVSVGQFKMFGGYYHANGARLITGYTTYNPTSTAGTGRNLNNTNIFSSQKGDDSSVNGDTYTYTLEKTNTGYVASMTGAGETITFDGVQNLMVQEDGSIIVGVANARVGVEITNITFEKTPGTIEGGVTAEQIDPKVTVFSSDVSGSTEYEFIVSPNVDGWLDLYDSMGNRVFEGNVKAEQVIKAPLTLPAGYNDLRYAFAPNPNVPNLTSYAEVSGYVRVTLQQWGEEGETIYVAPNGYPGAAGTQTNPLDLQTALNHAQPGQVIVMMDGTYYPVEDYIIPRSVNGTAEKPITLMAQTPGKVVIDGSNMLESTSLLTVVGSNWHVYGIEATNGVGKGISICGNNNIIEMCTVHHVANSGFQISRYAGEPNDNAMWPENNLVKNCEAYDCCDPGRSDADGFAAKLTCGEGNVFYGCISHHNIDDGWDLYAKSTTGPIGAVVIENCVAYSNGFLSTDDPTDPNTLFGEGNGFKLGGENMFGAHQLINSISYNNYGKGITSNSGPNCEVHNCTSFNNSLSGSSYNVSMYTKSDNPKAWVLDGVLSVVEAGGQASPVKELGASNGVLYSLRSATNYFYDGSSSTNTQGVEATAAWFVSTDVTIKPTRNADGTINMHGLLELLGSAPADTGARLSTTGEAISVQPGVTKTVSTARVIAFIGPAPSPVKSVNTGDATPLMPLMVIMMVSAGICAVYAFRRKRA